MSKPVRRHFSSLADYNQAFGIPAPEHPLIDVVRADSSQLKTGLGCNSQFVMTTDFYALSLKKLLSGEVIYGRGKYDCKQGTLLFSSPGQEIAFNGVVAESEAITITIHKEFIRGHVIAEQIKGYGFFDYAVNEALHLSPKEQQQILSLLIGIEAEYQNNADAFTKELILSQLATLLRYADRYYHRQFTLRKESGAPLFTRFEKVLLDSLVQHRYEDIPTVEWFADELGLTSRYLSDGLKAETGKTAKEWIHIKLIDLAKERLLSSTDSVADIAYQLGFEYPQYFSRLFKNKVGCTPTEFRRLQH